MNAKQIPKRPRKPFCIYCGDTTGKKARLDDYFCSDRCGWMAALVHYEDYEWDAEAHEWKEKERVDFA